MKPAQLAPRVHLFVCANRRDADSPLGPGCADAGQVVFARLKSEVARLGAYRAVWVTETKCLGVCPRSGAAVAVYPQQQVLTEVDPSDAEALFQDALAALGKDP